MSPEQRLWIAVVNQAFVDATMATPKVPEFEQWAEGRCKRRQKKGLEPESENALQAGHAARVESDLYRLSVVEAEREEARLWLLGDIPGLEEVCARAGLDPEYVTRISSKLASSGWVSPHQERALQAA